MQINNQITRFLFDDTDIRGEVVSMHEAYQDAYRHQDLPEALVPIFGEFLAGTALLAEVLKFEGILTVQARGDGDVALIMAETTDQGGMRGIVRMQPEKEVSNLEGKTLPQLLGSGVLTITIDPTKGQRYQGIVPIDRDSLAQCLEDYFSKSEQLPTQIQLFADQTHCGGLFLQCLPKQLVTDEEKRNDLWETSLQLAATLSAKELFELPNDQVLLRLFHDMKCRTFEPKALEFKCTCNKKRSGNAIQSLGYQDALALLRERGTIDIGCEFCGTRYRFEERDLLELFPGEGGSVH